MAASEDPEQLRLRRAALRLLGVDQLLLIVHGTSFPHSTGEDLGCGSPWSHAARRFQDTAFGLGFTGIQLGPQGRTTAVNPSPYDATLFSRDERQVVAGGLVEDGLLTAAEVEQAATRAADARDRVDHALARRLSTDLLAIAGDRFAARGGEESTEFRSFLAANADWLEPDALHEALATRHGSSHEHWPERVDRELFCPADDLHAAARARRGLLSTLLAIRLRRYRFAQFTVARQHAAWHAELRGRGASVYGDLQIGISHVDRWRLARCLLPDYLMGAPPSRTNPAGQPWGYPVLDPSKLDPDGAARAHWRTRIARAREDYDGLRIDHPHGHVCPWVYRAGEPDPYAAVRAGARLHESPDLPDHPALAAFARVRADQLTDDDRPRWAEDLVGELEPEQVTRYAALLDDLVTAWHPDRTVAVGQLACEVLSTCPRPLAATLERLGLGRFRVTAKADPDDPDDVYATERARPEDWVMVGNHDTAPLWATVQDWKSGDRALREAKRLATMLGAPDRAARLATDVDLLVHAKVADLFACPARRVMLFFADLLGLTATYNRPGEVHPDNWRLRVPSDWADRLAAPAARSALDVDRVLALALGMRAAAGDRECEALAARFPSAW